MFTYKTFSISQVLYFIYFQVSLAVDSVQKSLQLLSKGKLKEAYLSSKRALISSGKMSCIFRAATDESQKTRNKKQNGLAHSRFIVCVTPKQKKNIAWFENQVLAEHVRKSQSTIYLKSHGCVHGFQNEVSLINFSTMFCKPCSLSRNRSLRDAKSARHMFVWFAKHCLAEHCLSFRGDADECKKQFCFVFRICLAFFDSRLWRPLDCILYIYSF